MGGKSLPDCCCLVRGNHTRRNPWPRSPLRNYEAAGAELIMGSATFRGAKTVEVTLNDGGNRVLAGSGARPIL